MKKLIFVILFGLLMVGCSGKYVQPHGDDLGSVVIVEYPKINNITGIDTRLLIDDKIVYPERFAKLTPGIHEISIEITAFYNGRAKHAVPEVITLPVKPYHRYTIKIKTDRKVLNNVDENVYVQYIVLDDNKAIRKKKILLEDSFLRSIAEDSNEIVLESAVIQAASMGL